VFPALRQAGASAVIYGGMEAEGIVFDGVEQALALANVEIRLFGKPVSHLRRRMGVALASDEDTGTARHTARKAAGLVRPAPCEASGLWNCQAD
jgi:phosphoribosylglycinamide formyltransferase 2